MPTWLTYDEIAEIFWPHVGVTHIEKSVCGTAPHPRASEAPWGG